MIRRYRPCHTKKKGWGVFDLKRETRVENVKTRHEAVHLARALNKEYAELQKAENTWQR